MKHYLKLGAAAVLAAAALAGVAGCNNQSSQMAPETQTDPLKKPTLGSEAPKGEMVRPDNGPASAGGVSPGHLGR